MAELGGETPRDQCDVSTSLPTPGTDRAVANLKAMSDMMAITLSVFHCFQYVHEEAAADLEEAMERSPREHAEQIARLEEELRRAKEHLDELNEDLPANEMTAKAKEANIADMERLLFALKTAQMVAEQFPQGKNADEWRSLLLKAIREGQKDALLLLFTIVTLPDVTTGVIRGIAGVRSLRGFFAWLFRSPSPMIGPATIPRLPGPTPIPWNQYVHGHKRLLEELGRLKEAEIPDWAAIARAAIRVEEWLKRYTPMSPPSPRW